jgi:SOS-response transcriptional repressor LexA
MANPLGDFVTAKREKLRLSQSELAERAGVSHTYINQIERGVNPSTGKPISPTMQTLRKLAKGLQEDVDVLWRLAQGEMPLPLPPRTKQEIEERLHALRQELEATEDINDLPRIHAEMKKLKKMAADIDLIVERPPTPRERETEQILQAVAAGKWVKLPVYGIASCGSPAYIEDHPEDVMEWPEFMAKDADGILVVRGASMEAAGYRDGDLIFVRRINGVKPSNGNKVIACIDGDYTCKIYRCDEMGEYLEAAYAGDQTWRIPIRPGIKLVALVVYHIRKEIP